MFAVHYDNGTTGYFGFTDGKIIADDGSLFVVGVWNDDKNPTRCIFVNAGNVFPI